MMLAATQANVLGKKCNPVPKKSAWSRDRRMIPNIAVCPFREKLVEKAHWYVSRLNIRKYKPKVKVVADFSTMPFPFFVI